ncbi:MAG: hypothetical protein ACR2L8_00450 [Solirubrobacteraceae bacterium]
MSAGSSARRLVRRYVPARVRKRLLRPPSPRPPARTKANRPPRRPSLLQSLERGEPLDRAVIAQIRSLIAASEHHRAQSIAEGLRVQPETATLGHLAGGIVAFKRGFRELAWHELRDVPRATWAQFAPAEFVRSGLSVAADDALREIRELVADDPAEVRARSWYEILAAVWGLGASELAREVFAIFDRHVREDAPLWRDAERHRDWMRPWVAADADSPTAPGDGRRTFAVMDYGHPSANKASANIGDHIQSIAALGHLVRHRGVRFHGHSDLVDLLAQLSGRTRPERRCRHVDADLEVIRVHRDASIYEPVPEDTWVLAFGWFMHSLFNMRHGFPLHRNLRPIFVSFHCNKRDLLTPEAIEYLKRYGPVCCRDWTTVYLLLSIGVPAFFSGCLTTTIDTVFPDLPAGPPADAPLAYVDMAGEAPPGAVTYKHSRGAVRRGSFVGNVQTALELLETYRRRHRGVVTSRLHCYLPVRSLGVDVEFRPKNRSDIRLDGLIDITDEAFDAIRDGLLDKLEQVFTAISTGRPEADVYALWREITAADVAAAAAAAAAEARIGPGGRDVSGRVGAAVSRSVAHAGRSGGPAGDPVHCAVVLPEGGGVSVSVLIASLLEHATRPLHLWVLARPGTEAIERRVATRFPQLRFTWVPTRGLARGLRTATGGRPDPEGMVRLLLAELLGTVERVVVLSLPSLATGDVAELADLDLGRHVLAAPRRTGVAEVSGFGVIHAAAARLGDRNEAAAVLRRTAHARHAFDFDAFTDDVLVLDLARMRQSGFSGQALALVEEFGLTALEVLHHLYGPQRATVPERWAAVPTRVAQRRPGLIHWADRVKPWQRALTPERDRWRRYAAAFTPPQA